MEDPSAIINLNQYLTEASWNNNRLRGIIFGAEDFAQEMGITRSSSLIEMLYARQQAVTIAKAHQIECLDLVLLPFPHNFSH